MDFGAQPSSKSDAMKVPPGFVDGPDNTVRARRRRASGRREKENLRPEYLSRMLPRLRYPAEIACSVYEDTG